MWGRGSPIYLPGFDESMKGTHLDISAALRTDQREMEVEVTETLEIA